MDKVFQIIGLLPGLGTLVHAAEIMFTGSKQGPDKQAAVIAAGKGLLQDMVKSNVLKESHLDYYEQGLPDAVNATVALYKLVGNVQDAIRNHTPATAAKALGIDQANGTGQDAKQGA